jgi:hypothetical protein
MSVEELAVHAISVSAGREGRERAVHDLASRAREAEHRVKVLENRVQMLEDDQDTLLELAHWTNRMLQALDAYWEHCEGLSERKLKTVRSTSTDEDWWIRYEKYRARVETLVRD